MLKSDFMVALIVFITGIQRTCMIGRLGQFSSALCSRGPVLGMRSQGWDSRSSLFCPHRLLSFLDGSDHLLKGQALELRLCSKGGLHISASTFRRGLLAPILLFLLLEFHISPSFQYSLRKRLLPEVDIHLYSQELLRRNYHSLVRGAWVIKAEKAVQTAASSHEHGYCVIYLY